MKRCLAFLLCLPVALLIASCQAQPTAPATRLAEGKLVTRARSVTADPVPPAVDDTMLAVVLAQPESGRVEVDPQTPVSVIFNRPVVPLRAPGDQAGLPAPLIFSPPVAGKGEWINTSVYVFHPTEGFLPATDYTVQIPAGLTDTTGTALAEEYRWHFTTIRPTVYSIWPEADFDYFRPGDVITVTFNQPMDHAATEAAFSLWVNGARWPGSFGWIGGEKATSWEKLVFTPTEALARNSVGVIRLASSARGRFGTLGLGAELMQNFSSIGSAGVVRTTPGDGAVNQSPDSGFVELVFASPMNTEVFTRHLHFTPPLADVEFYWNDLNTAVRLYFGTKPQRDYRIELDARTPDVYGETLGKPFALRFQTGVVSPWTYWNRRSREGFFDADHETELFATAINVSRLDLTLYRWPLSSYLVSTGEWNGIRSQAENIVRIWSQPLNLPPNSYQIIRNRMTDEAGEPVPPGIYHLKMTTPELFMGKGNYIFSDIFVKSHLNLTLKHAQDGALVWATDLKNGRPVEGLSVTFYCGNSAVVTGTTDVRGLYAAADPRLGRCGGIVRAIAGEPGDDNFGVGTVDWNEGIYPGDFGIAAEYHSSPYRVALYTDRPVYRPGQTVYFKEIVRNDQDALYTVPLDDPGLTVIVEDPQSKVIYSQTLSLNDMGSADGRFVLDGEAALGEYRIQIPSGYWWTLQSVPFRVAEYRKPDYQLEVATERPAYTAGDTISATARARYYFGGALAKMKATWALYQEPYGFSYACPREMGCGWYNFSDRLAEMTGRGLPQSNGRRAAAEGEGTTNAEGNFSFQVPADLSTATGSRNFVLEVSVTDAGGKEVSQRTTVPVHRGEFYIGTAMANYIGRVGEAQTVNLLAVAPSLASGKPNALRPGQLLQVTFVECRWYSVKQKAEDGEFYWTWALDETPVFRATVRTGEDGRATASFTPPRAGLYGVRVEGRDGRGQQLSSSDLFWVGGGSNYVQWKQESNNRIALVADKGSYQIGDVAEILVPSPYKGPVAALVTVERGRIFTATVMTLTGNSTLLQIPITSEMYPNAYVSVILMQGSAQSADDLATFKMGLIHLPVVSQEKVLQVTLTPDKDRTVGEVYHPRETATFDLRVTDFQGRPVEAEVSLRLADLAALDLGSERDPGLQAIFWSPRGLGVETGVALTAAMEPLNRELAPGAKGGGGGDALTRSEFADTAYWNATVRTDKEGHAQVTVTLPDNLTTWRMQAKAITVDARVGRADVDIVSTLDLLVRPVLPRFFVTGDQATLGTVVHNTSARELTATVSFAATGLALSVPESQTVIVPAHGEAAVSWSVTAQEVDEAAVRMAVQAEGQVAVADAREDRLPVYRYSTPEVVATAGWLSGTGRALEQIEVPSTADLSAGGMTVRIDGSLTAAAQPALTYLKDYPYGCNEQTVSRFLPDLIAYRALERAGQGREDLKAVLTTRVETALQRLYDARNYDNGWGWWPEGASDPYITAYVLQALLEADRNGYAADEWVMMRAASYLRKNLQSPEELATHGAANRQAYELYVLAEYGARFPDDIQGELGRTVTLFEERRRLDLYGKAYLAQALAHLLPKDSPYVKTLLAELGEAAVIGARGVYWEEAAPDSWNMNTDRRTTAVVLWTLAELQPENELLPGAVRWLMAAREEGRWGSTQETAWALLALTAYQEASGELAGDFDYTVTLNGRTLAETQVTTATLDQPQVLTLTLSELSAGATNDLEIARQGEAGELYYDVALRTYRPAEAVPALDRGIMVARQYSLLSDPGKSITQAAVGDLIQVKVTLVTLHDLHYVAIEDPLPAGCEAVDSALSTTSIQGMQYNVSWRWWISHRDLRDEKAVFFANYLTPGTYEYTYVIRAGLPGRFRVLPATAMELYFPEVFGRSEGTLFTIEK